MFYGVRGSTACHDGAAEYAARGSTIGLDVFATREGLEISCPLDRS